MGVLGGIALIIPFPFLVVGSVMVLAALSLLFPLAMMGLLAVLAPMRSLLLIHAPFRLPDIGQVLFVMLALSLVTHVMLSRHPKKMLFSWSFAPLAFFLLVATSTLFNAFSFSAAFVEWLKWVSMLLLAWCVLQISTKDVWQWLIFMLVTAALANGLIGFYIFFGGTGVDHFLIGGGFFRAFGTFEQPNPFGAFMGISLPVALMSALAYWRVRSRWLALYYALVSGVIGVALLMSWSRGAWIAVAGALVVVAFMIPRKPIIRVFTLVAVTTLLGGAFFLNLIPNALIQRLETSFEELFAITDVRGVQITTENYAVIERLAHWQAATEMARYHPFGVGIGNYESAYASYRLINWVDSLGHAHNYYLNLLAEVGILGLIAYLIFQAHWMLLCWRLSAHPDEVVRLTSIGILGAIVYIALHSFFDNVYVNNLFLHIAIIFGIVITLHTRMMQNLQLE